MEAEILARIGIKISSKDAVIHLIKHRCINSLPPCALAHTRVIYMGCLVPSEHGQYRFRALPGLCWHSSVIPGAN
jgi:hypothetical protein